MSRIVLVLLAALAVFSASSSGQECGLNEEWTTCGTACPPRCIAPRALICTQQCVIGCKCMDGYLRNSKGTCVRPEDC